MKHFFFTFLLFGGIIGSAAAQGEDEPRRPHLRLHHEITINVTSFFDKLVRIPQDSANVSPYLLGYRISTRGWGLRLSGGGSYQQQDASEKGFADVVATQRWQADVRLGIDRTIGLGRRFKGSFGLDFVGQSQKNEVVNDSGFDVVTRVEQFRSWGGGPCVGLQFWCTKHIALSAESCFYWTVGERESARFFKNFPELDDAVNVTSSTSLRKILPSSIFLTYQF